jgi:hypothetical protein
MFPRVARNFIKNGYYPTDGATLGRVLRALTPAPEGTLCVLDPCAGEGVALAEAAHALGRGRLLAYGVELDTERAAHAKQLLDRCLQADLMESVISQQSFGLLWLNPPYGDLSKDVNGKIGYSGSGRARLEKLFYQKSWQLLQYGGVLVFIIPYTTLDAEIAGWLARSFTDLRVFRAVDETFRQVVIFGRRCRQREQRAEAVRAAREALLQAAQEPETVPVLPEAWPYAPYQVPASSGPEHFYRLSMDTQQLSEELKRLTGLWPTFTTHLARARQAARPPAQALSSWHLALALAAGAISGVIRSARGRLFVLRGDTYKGKRHTVETEALPDGGFKETHTRTDTFVPVIRAWDMTPDAPTFGEIVTIR